MASLKSETLTSPVKKEHKPNSQAFLDNLSMDEAKAWRKDIIICGPYVKLVNHRHITSTLTVDQLKLATSIGPFTGAYFMEWMECEIRKEHMLNPPRRHPCVTVYRNGAPSSSIEEKTSTFFSSNSLEDVSICPHHITLRSMQKDSLPLLSSFSGSKQASHLCDTKGCILEDHLLIETNEENNSRRMCFGIMMRIHENSSGDHCITQVKLCKHGRQLKKSTFEQQLKHSCRKIQTIIFNDEHIPLYK